MTPLLQPIEGLEFDSESHRYRFNGRWLHTSPTGVLSIDLDDHAKQRIEETRHVWEPRGNHLHLWLHHYLSGAAELDPGEYADWVGPLRDCWLWKDATTLATELMLVDEKRNMGGSVDFIIKTGKTGAITIGDLKTVSSKKAADQRKFPYEQLGAYIRMINQCYGHIYIEKAVMVVAAPGYCKVVSGEIDSCSVAWEDAWEKYQQHQKVHVGF